MKNTVLFLPIAALAFSVAATNAQGQATGAGSTAGSPASGTTSSGGSSTGRNPGVLLPTAPTTNGSQSNTSGRTVFITGKVAMDDGSEVPANVVIQKVCNGVARSVAYADGTGHFSFQWGSGQPSTIMADASEAGSGGPMSRGGGGFGGASSAGGSNPMGSDPLSRQMTNCEIRAQMAGYRSELISLVNRNPLDNPDIGLIVLHRLGASEGTSVSATSFMAPKDAKKAYEKGLVSMQKNKPEDASKEFEKAVLAYPKYADAWLSLGRARAEQGAYEPAREALLKAIEADSKLVGPYIELGLMAAQQNKWAEAGPYLDRGLRLDPIDFPQAWYIDAAANFNLKKYDAAEKSIREAIKLDPKRTNVRIDYLLGLILAEKHDFPAAAEQFRIYLKNAPDAPDFAKIKDQLAQVEKYLDQQQASKQP